MLEALIKKLRLVGVASRSSSYKTRKRGFAPLSAKGDGHTYTSLLSNSRLRMVLTLVGTTTVTTDELVSLRVAVRVP